MRRRAWPTTQATTSPTATPPKTDSASEPVALAASNAPLTAAALAVATSANATPSLNRLSPWTTATRRGSAPAPPITCTGARASVAPSAAPSTNATSQEIPRST